MNAWQEILGYLKAKVNTLSYQTWLRPTLFSHVEQEELVVRVPNREFQDWIQEHYGSLINEAIAQLPSLLATRRAPAIDWHMPSAAIEATSAVSSIATLE